jgi:hypothetical protein
MLDDGRQEDSIPHRRGNHPRQAACGRWGERSPGKPITSIRELQRVLSTRGRVAGRPVAIEPTFKPITRWPAARAPRNALGRCPFSHSPRVTEVNIAAPAQRQVIGIRFGGRVTIGRRPRHAIPSYQTPLRLPFFSHTRRTGCPASPDLWMAKATSSVLRPSSPEIREGSSPRMTFAKCRNSFTYGSSPWITFTPCSVMG